MSKYCVFALVMMLQLSVLQRIYYAMAVKIASMFKCARLVVATFSLHAMDIMIANILGRQVRESFLQQMLLAFYYKSM